MKIWVVAIASLSGILLSTSPLAADPIPVPGSASVTTAFNRADLVCLCLVESTTVESQQMAYRNGKPVTQRHISAQVLVEDLYKGSEPASASVTLGYDDELPSVSWIPSVTPGHLALLFLKTGREGYSFVDKFLGSVGFDSMPAQNGLEGLDKLELAIASIAARSGPNDQLTALRILEGFDKLHPAAMQEVAQLTTSSNVDVALSAIAVLVKHAPATGVRNLVAYLKNYQGDDAHMAFMSIASELGQVRDPSAELDLESLATCRFQGVRAEAVDAIRSLKDPHSAPVLVGRLDDPDPNIRYVAVISLAELYHKYGDYGPAMNSFRQRPDFYTTLWKNWWTQHQAK